MPAIRHLNLYDDTLLPEPDSLKTKHVGKSSPARYQQMNIDKDLDFKNDLFFYDQIEDKNDSSKDIESKAKLNLSAMILNLLLSMLLGANQPQNSLPLELYSNNLI